MTVQYSTQNNTATAPADYTAATSQTLTFNPGMTSIPLTIPAVGDTAVEPNETFFVNLSNPTNATISDALALATITNDDSAGTVKDIVVVSGQTKAVEGGAGASLLHTSRHDRSNSRSLNRDASYLAQFDGESLADDSCSALRG